MEVEAHRTFAVGMTASEPEWKEVDLAGNKGWVIDVHFGPNVGDENGTEENVMKDVPIASVARQSVSDANIPVVLERSKQIGWSVVGRSHIVPGGFILGSVVVEDTYHRIQYNYRTLRLMHIPDLDFTLETLDEAVARWNTGDESALQIVRATDAFDHQVMGPETSNPPQAIQDRLSASPMKSGKARHLTVRPETFAEAVARFNSGDVSRAQLTIRTLVEATI
jgi:hypothetical protein